MSEFKVLTDREHILARAGMYLGSTSLEPHTSIINFQYQTKHVVPALLKIISEILDNTVDEHIRTNGEYANRVSVDVVDGVEGTEITITDNGRGIPVKQIGESYQPVLSWTKARAGSNFGDTRTTIGANGVGSFATNCFSKSFIGTTSDGVNKIVVKCSDNCANVDFKVYKSPNKGTSVSFIPDLEKFGLKEFDQDHLDVLYDRINNLAICYPGIQFKFNGEKIQFKNLKQIASYFSENTVSVEIPQGQLVFASSGKDEEFRFSSYVNGLNIKNGGSHLDYIMEAVIANIRPVVKKKWKIDVLPNQIKQHLLCASWLTGFPNLKFDSQTKERITNTKGEVMEFLEGFTEVAESIAKKIVNTPEIIQPMVEAILHKKELQERREAAAAIKKTKKKNIANHLAASSQNWKEKKIFLTEGLSAIGALIKVRDSKTEGGYALRGKVMNTAGMKTIEIVKNKELSELLTVIGLDLDTEEINHLNYGKICVLTDADYDGSSIFCLLLQFFSRWPKLFEEGRICRVITPLYIAKKKGDSQWFYTQQEFDEAKDKLSGYEINYNKGLGSLDENDYETMIKKPYLLEVKLGDEGLSKLEMAFGDSADVRKEWMMNI